MLKQYKIKILYKWQCKKYKIKKQFVNNLKIKIINNKIYKSQMI